MVLCNYCMRTDTAKYMIFHCPKLDTERTRTEQGINVGINRNNIVSIILANERQWNDIKYLINSITKTKEGDER